SPPTMPRSASRRARTTSRWHGRRFSTDAARTRPHGDRAPVGGDVEFALISLLNGVTYGLLLFMLSSGLTLIFSMMSVLNFEHASFFMLGAYFAYQISCAASFWAALFPSPLPVAVLGALVEVFGVR